jgi:hypothetical protein
VTTIAPGTCEIEKRGQWPIGETAVARSRESDGRYCRNDIFWIDLRIGEEEREIAKCEGEPGRGGRASLGQSTRSTREGSKRPRRISRRPIHLPITVRGRDGKIARSRQRFLFPTTAQP